jgi:hypothetical protein
MSMIHFSAAPPVCLRRIMTAAPGRMPRVLDVFVDGATTTAPGCTSCDGRRSSGTASCTARGGHRYLPRRALFVRDFLKGHLHIPDTHDASLSGCQNQCLGIVRSLLRGPTLLILS